MAATFTVTVKHKKTPLAGVLVTVTRYRETLPPELFIITTDHKGQAQIANLAPGNYDLKTDHLGFSAGGGCFHVAERPSRKATGRLNYNWGRGTSVRRAAGRLTESQMASEGTVIERMVNSRMVAMVGVNLSLEHGITHEKYHTVSSQDGTFDFGLVPQGVYVLRAWGSKGGRPFAEDLKLIEITPLGRYAALDLQRAQNMCGPTPDSLVLRPATAPSR